MKTTDLFVEIIVIGIGAVISLLLFIFGVFGYEWVPFDEAVSLVALIPFISVIYVLGIVIDRVADKLFDGWAKAIRVKVYSTQHEDNASHNGQATPRISFRPKPAVSAECKKKITEQFFKDRRYIYIHPSRLADHLEYNRSRLRVCRGWTLNLLLILITYHFFMLQQPPEHVFVSFEIVYYLIALLMISTCYSWWHFTSEYVSKIRRQAKYLHKHDTSNQDGSTAGPIAD